MNIRPLLAFTALLATTSAGAHGIWVAERLDRPTIVYGDGGEDSRYDSGRVGRVVGLTTNNEVVAITVGRGADNAWLEVPKDIAVATVQFHESYHTKDANNTWHKLPKKDVPNAVSSSKSAMSAITLFEHQKESQLFAHLPLQITALKDPLSLKKGDVLPVQVSFNGKPLADAPLIADYLADPSNSIKTDKNGNAFIKLGSNTVNVLYTYHKAPSDEPDVDNMTYVNTLSFSVQPTH